MIRRSFLVGAILALSTTIPTHSAHAQSSPPTLTVDGSSSAIVHPGDTLTVAGSVSNCGPQAATISVTLTITRDGIPLGSYTRSFLLQPGQTHPESTSFVVPNLPGV